MTNRTDLNIWPLLTSPDALALRGWLTRIGFVEGICVPGDQQGSVMHSEMLWPDGGRLMVCTAAADNQHLVPAGSASIYVTVLDADEVYARAQEMGADITRPIESADSYDGRGFSVRTPDGHRISFGTYAG